MKHRILPSYSSLVGAALILGACADGDSVTGPSDNVPQPATPALATVLCTANTEAKTIDCATPAETSGDLSIGKSQLRPVIIGGQNENVRLTSSNVGVAEGIFAFDVTVQNLIPQPLGTITGTDVHPTGVRVFFASGPTSSEGGEVSVRNPDGIATFTETSQPYFQYDELLISGQTTAAKRWELDFTEGVSTFNFTLYVSAEVLYPDGYVEGIPYVITLNPNESRSLSSLVRTATGRPASDAAPTVWNSDSPAIAAISGTTVTAGGSRGVTMLTATSGSRPAVYPTTVSVCEATVVSHGTVLPSSISSTDCYSSYGSNTGLPTTSYYGDLYRVSLTQGQTLTVTLDPGDDFDTYLLLAAPESGFVVAANDDDDEGILGWGSRIVYTATETGVHVIEASTFNGLDTGDYVLEVEIDAPGVAMSRASAAPAPKLGR